MTYKDTLLALLIVAAANEYGKVTLPDLHEIINGWLERGHKVSVLELMNFAEAFDKGTLFLTEDTIQVK